MMGGPPMGGGPMMNQGGGYGNGYGGDNGGGGGMRSKKSEPCNDFMKGRCSRGESCIFSHDVRKREVCNDFLKVNKCILSIDRSIDLFIYLGVSF